MFVPASYVSSTGDVEGAEPAYKEALNESSRSCWEAHLSLPGCIAPLISSRRRRKSMVLHCLAAREEEIVRQRKSNGEKCHNLSTPFRETLIVN